MEQVFAAERDADDSPRPNSIRRMVDAAETGYLTVLFLCPGKSWAVNDEVIAADVSIIVRAGGVIPCASAGYQPPRCDLRSSGG